MSSISGSRIMDRTVGVVGVRLDEYNNVSSVLHSK